MTGRIKSVELLVADVPLKRPYVLSFGTIHAVSSIVVCIHTADGVGFGEAVPLPGYSEETKESIIKGLGGILAKLPGLLLEDIHSLAKRTLAGSPFAASALLAAKEMAAGELQPPNQLHVPLLATVSASREPEALVKRIRALCGRGFRTIKLKVGRDFQADIATLRLLLTEMPAGVRLRIDANQGYSMSEAQAVTDLIGQYPNHAVELVEQPFGTDDKSWAMLKSLSKVSGNVPLMLDESIVCESDIEKAADCGAEYVKLKLFKQGGVSDLLRLAEMARRFGLKVVIGNGVSTEIGNVMEGIAYCSGELFCGASEGNGFEKLVSHVMDPEPVVDNGCMVWNAPCDGSIGHLRTDRYQQISRFTG